MKYQRLKCWGAICLSMMLCSSNLPISMMAMQQVQAQEACMLTETTSTAPTEDLEFLSKCDESLLITQTVTDKQAAEMLAAIEPTIKSGKSDYEKAKLLHNWVNSNVKYETSHVAISTDPYQVFRDKRAVCGGFARLYKELLNLIGIPAVSVCGYYNVYGAHEWNAVYVDGRWIYADSVGYWHFDTEDMLKTHDVLEVADANIVVDGVVYGYYNGVAVMGTEKPTSEINIADTVEGMPVTSVSYKLFDKKNGVQKINIGENIIAIEESTLKSSENIKEITVSENNKNYASKEGALFTKDYSALIYYPAAREAETFTLPAETRSVDTKEALCNMNLKYIYVEDGSPYYSSYDGALYNADKTELLFLPLSRTSVKVLENAQISELAFANIEDKSKITIYGEKGSPAEQYANWYKEIGIKFVEMEICDHKLDKVAEKAAACTENGNHEYYVCTKCNMVYKDVYASVETTVAAETVGAAGHTLDAGKITEAATCAKEGVKTFRCTSCTYQEAQSVPKTTVHIWNGGAITTPGEKTYTCTLCGASKTETVPVEDDNKNDNEKPSKVTVMKKGARVTQKDCTYKVTKSTVKGGTVTFVKAKKNVKRITVPATIKVKGITYKVTAIEKNAFQDQKKVTQITIGSNVSKLGANAFKGCKKLKTITIQSKKLTKKNIAKNAFKGLGKATTIKVPKNKVKNYKVIFRTRGLNSKVKVTK